MDLGISGETALVVGGSYGIGYESAKALLQEGADVLIASRDRARLDEAAKSLKADTGRDVATFVADVLEAEDVTALAGWVTERTKQLDILVSAVGGSQRKAFADLTDEEWLHNYHFNVLGAVRVVRAMLPALRAADQGRVVLLGAAAARMPYPHQIVSNVHKAGVLSLTKTLAAELAPEGIRINSVCPGRTLTPLWINRAGGIARERGVDPQVVIEEFSEEIPMKRFGRPEETAAMVVFLASHKSSYVTGQSVNVDGGIARGLL
ncbi:MAG: SDR family oxidoreductase [Acetobacterales bacterium]